MLIVSFIYGYVYRKKSKNRRKSEQEEDGGAGVGKNVVAVAAENAEANTLYIKEGGTIEGAQSKIIF